MYEYQIQNIHTGAMEFLWGYSWKDAARRAKASDSTWNEADFQVVRMEYVD